MDEGRTCSIGVVIPAHRHHHLLRETLERVANQTVAPLGAIVVVDGPDPETERVARSSGLDCEVLVLPRPTGGPSQPRNEGAKRLLDRHNPDGIWFLDADDLPDPRFLEVVSRELDRHPGASMIATRFVDWWEGESLPERSATNDSNPATEPIGLDAYLGSTGSILPSFSVLRSSVLTRIRDDGQPFDESIRINNDLDAFVRSLHLASGIMVDWVGGLYRIHPAGISDSGVRLNLCRSHCTESLANWFERCGEPDLANRFRRMMGTSKRKAARMLWRRNHRGDRRQAFELLSQSVVEDGDLRSLPLMLTLPFSAAFATRGGSAGGMDTRRSQFERTKSAD